MKKWVIYIMCICLLFSIPAQAATVSMEYNATDLDVPLTADSVTTATDAIQLDIKAKSAILLEPVTGQILYESNADEQTAPASITKIMSLLLVMEALENGTLALDTVVTASEHACSMGGSQIWLEPNEKMTVDELLKAAVIASANDATVALGEAIAGSEEGFVNLMNEKAKALGMNNTHFINCTGLDAEGHLTSAHDVAIMSAQLRRNDHIKQYSTVWMDSLRNGESELVNTNKLVRFYEGCTGLKTGTTSSAGYCLSATAERGGMQLVAVVMDGETSTDRFEGAKKLLNYGFANYSFTTVKADLGENPTIKVNRGITDSVGVTAKSELSILLPKTTAANITQTIDLPEAIDAPVNTTDTIGHIYVMNGEERIGVIELAAASTVDRLNISHTFVWLLKALFCL